MSRAVVVAPGERNRRTLHATIESAVELDLDTVRQLLAERCPAYAIPGRISVVERLPLTANGKIDRAALMAAAVGGAEGRAGQGQPPSGPVEEAVAALWSEILDASVADRDTSFFSLGGDSMGALRMATLLRDRLGVDVAVRDLLAEPTVEAVSALAVASGATTDEYETGTL